MDAFLTSNRKRAASPNDEEPKGGKKAAKALKTVVESDSEDGEPVVKPPTAKGHKKDKKSTKTAEDDEGETGGNSEKKDKAGGNSEKKEKKKITKTYREVLHEIDPAANVTRIANPLAQTLAQQKASCKYLEALIDYIAQSAFTEEGHEAWWQIKAKIMALYYPDAAEKAEASTQTDS